MSKGRRASVTVVAAALAVSACDLSTEVSWPDDSLIQTDAPSYALHEDGEGLAVQIPYTFTNRTNQIVYIVNCNGAFGQTLERRTTFGWEAVQSPPIPQCLSEPIVIEPGAVFSAAMHVWAAPPGAEIHPQWDTDDPSGVYRIVWTNALASYDASSYPFGEPIAAELRTSNSFLLTVE